MGGRMRYKISPAINLAWILLFQTITPTLAAEVGTLPARATAAEDRTSDCSSSDSATTLAAARHLGQLSLLLPKERHTQTLVERAAERGAIMRRLEPQVPVCPCCTRDPTCCDGNCHQTMFAPMLGALEGMTPKTKPASPPVSCRVQKNIENRTLADSDQIEAFYNLASVKACEEFLPKLIPKRKEIYQNLQKGAITSEMQELSTNYSRLCLESMTVYLPMLSRNEIEQVHERLAFLLDAKGQVNCHGFRINRYVVTARHCLPAVGKFADVRFAGAPDVFKGAPVAIGGSDAAEEDDYGLLQLKDYNAVTLDSELNWIGEPQPMDRVAIFQSNVYKRIAAGSAAHANLNDSLTREDNPFCRLYGVTSEGFLLHPCQTEWGSSGTPYFQRDPSGWLRVVGVHAGATIGLSAPELNACRVALSNYGVRIPAAALRQIIGAGK